MSEPNICENCEYLVDVFGNYVQCIKTGRFVNYEYWHNIQPEDCPKSRQLELDGEK